VTAWRSAPRHFSSSNSFSGSRSTVNPPEFALPDIYLVLENMIREIDQASHAAANDEKLR
jgi:hypothetical protein